MERCIGAFLVLLLSLSGCQVMAKSFGIKPGFLKEQNTSDAVEATSLRVSRPALADFRFSLGQFMISWTGAAVGQGQLKIMHPERGADPIWMTVPGRTFVEAGLGSAVIHEKRGSFRVSDRRQLTCAQQVLDAWKATQQEITLSGSFADQGCGLRWTMRLSPLDAERLSFAVTVAGAPAGEHSRIFVRYASRPEEHFYGFGMQFSELDLKGRMLPILTQEQGVGRGLSPLSTAVELLGGKGVAGDWWTSYGTVPHYITSDLRSVYLENTEFAAIDLRHPSEVRIAIMADRLAGAVLVGRDYPKLIEVYTRYAGRMQPLPAWVDRGAIIGVQGGTARVRRVYQTLKESGVPISALWIQDWVGRRTTAFGSQLWWNWELDQDFYPGWTELVADLAKDQVRVLTYVNPFLADVTEKSNARRLLFREAEKAGFLVKNPAGKTYMIENTSFSAGLLDLSNPSSRRWMISVLKDQVIKAGASGWMADFGEALPFDAVLNAGKGMTAHNAYPEDWAQLNRQALEESGLWDDALIFSRSAFTRSPGKTRLFWLGDQLVTWDDHDGMKTALVGLLSSGLSGFSLNHSDTGGYTTVNNPILKYHRSPELLKRWTELNAFTPVLRTHEGNIPEVNAQVYDNDTARSHFAKFSRVYRALAPYRRDLMAEASRSGMPLVRPLFLAYPADPKVSARKGSFLLGGDILVAPVLDEGKSSVEVYLPEDGWVHVASGKGFRAGMYTVEAPIGSPAVFYHGRGRPVPSWVGELRQSLVSSLSRP